MPNPGRGHGAPRLSPPYACLKIAAKRDCSSAMPYLPSPGRCIYCPATDGLTDEHIIPMALGGRLVLQNASCRACAKITRNFERIVTREMYWPLRLRLGVKGSRKHKDRPTHWPGVLTDDDKITEMAIEVGKLPTIYGILEMAPPGFTTGEPLTEGNPPMKVHIKMDQSEVDQFLKEYEAGKFKFEVTLQWGPFSRMIAKICHGYAISVLGLEGIEFFLPPLILGASHHLAQFVGGISHPEHALRPPTDISLALFGKPNGELYVIGRTTIFGNDRFPTYETVIGRITDRDLISAKMACAQQR